MRAYGFAIGVLISLGVGGVMLRALPQSVPDGAAPHVAAAKAAVGQHAGARVLFERLCAAPPPVRPPRSGPQPAAQLPAPPARAEWYAEPVKVFDNLYFVGQTAYTAWAVVTSEGIIVIDRRVKGCADMPRLVTALRARDQRLGIGGSVANVAQNLTRAAAEFQQRTGHPPALALR